MKTVEEIKKAIEAAKNNSFMGHPMHGIMFSLCDLVSAQQRAIEARPLLMHVDDADKQMHEQIHSIQTQLSAMQAAYTPALLRHLRLPTGLMCGEIEDQGTAITTAVSEVTCPACLAMMNFGVPVRVTTYGNPYQCECKHDVFRVINSPDYICTKCGRNSHLPSAIATRVTAAPPPPHKSRGRERAEKMFPIKFDGGNRWIDISPQPGLSVASGGFLVSEHGNRDGVRRYLIDILAAALDAAEAEVAATRDRQWSDAWHMATGRCAPGNPQMVGDVMATEVKSIHSEGRAEERREIMQEFDRGGGSYAGLMTWIRHRDRAAAQKGQGNGK